MVINLKREQLAEVCEFSSHVQLPTCACIGGRLDFIKACVLSEKYCEARERGKGTKVIFEGVIIITNHRI